MADGVEITVLAGTHFAKLTEPKTEPKEIVNPVKQPIVTKYEPVQKNRLSHSLPKQLHLRRLSLIRPLEQQGILSEIKSMCTMMQEQLASMSWSDMQHRDPKRSRILSSLLNAGFSPALSSVNSAHLARLPQTEANFPAVLDAPTVPLSPTADWANVGNTSPAAAMQTLNWAMMKHDENAFSSLIAWDADAKAKVEALLTPRRKPSGKSWLRR